MNENYLTYGMMGVVLIVGLAGLYYMVNEPGMSGAFNLAGMQSIDVGLLENNYFTSSAEVITITNTINCYLQITTGTGQSTASSNTEVNVPIEPPDPLVGGGPLLPYSDGYSLTSTFNCDPEAARYQYFGEPTTVSAYLTAPLPPVIPNLGFFVRPYTGLEGTVISAYTEPDTTLGLTTTPQTLCTTTGNTDLFVFKTVTTDNSEAIATTGNVVVSETISFAT